MPAITLPCGKDTKVLPCLRSLQGTRESSRAAFACARDNE